MDFLGKIFPFPATHGACTMAHATSCCCITAPLCFLPQMIKSLKKAMAPVLSDVSVEWVFPESTEVLVSPVSTSCLFPGDRLVGYGVICDTSPYISNPRSVSPRCAGWWGCPRSGGVSVSICTSRRLGSLCLVRRCPLAFSLCPQGRRCVRHQGETGAWWIRVLAHKQWAGGHGGRTYSLSLLSPRIRGDVTA